MFEVKALFLVCALALPAANPREDYMLLKQYIETRWPDKYVCFSGPETKLANAEDTGINIVDPKDYHTKLHVWIGRSA